MQNNRQSIWNAAFPENEPVVMREHDFSVHPKYQQATPVQTPAQPPQDYYQQPPQAYAPPVQYVPVSRFEPLPGQKMLIGSVVAIVGGVAAALGYNIGLPITPGEGVQMAWGGAMGIFAHLRLKKMG